MSEALARSAVIQESEPTKDKYFLVALLENNLVQSVVTHLSKEEAERVKTEWLAGTYGLLSE